ncbi:PHD finger protein 3 [Trichonephila inaurata madagascariensis]|uniref:PHD finger protein 3 n=1 Tax=Trichonephila inaurata madagascariensis TaxID=2747483 RepID=A0A8X7C6D3_9ARAC|nr:PHD finger protein 3 [Trichonephila inaurata madagascariensis]
MQRFMIQCDKCKEWFHGSCVGVTKLYGRQLEQQKKEWICPVCRMKGGTFLPQDEKSHNEIYELENLHRKNSKKSVKANNRCGTHEKIEAISDTQNFVNLENIKTPVHDFEAPVLDFKTPVHEAKTSVHEVKSPVHETKTPMHEVKSPVQEERIHVLEEHCFVQEIQTSIPEVNTAIEKLNTCVQEVKTPVKSSTNDGSLNSGSFLKKGNSNAKMMPKAEKGSKKKNSKQSAPVAPKQNLLVNLLPLAHRRKISMSSKKFASSTMKSRAQKKSPMPKQSVFLSEDIVQNKKDTNIKTPSHDAEKPNFESTSLRIKKRASVPLKEKGNIKKKLSCVYCNIEAKANACYCSDSCIEKYATECLNTMREAKGTSTGVDFDSQRLVVLDRLKGNVITSENGPTAGEIISWLKANPSFIIFPSPSVPSVKKVKECDSTSGAEKKDAADKKAKATIRLNVRKTLKNILMDRCKNADDIEMLEEDVQKIAVKIEEELNSLFKDNSFKYRAKYRSLMFNIKDPRNQGLFRKILKGNIPPDRLVRMSPEELASLELARWREQENQHLLDMIKRVQLEQQKSGNGLFLKKTHKGEVEIEDDLTSVIEDIPKTQPKDILEDLEQREEEVEDSTHIHRSHLFDLNCTSKKSASKAVAEKSPVSNSGEDSLDRESTSSVSFVSPVVGVKPCIIEPSSKAVWKGFIVMQEVAKFVTSAYKVSGHTDRLQADLPDTICVCGRIIPDQVWDYLSKIKQSGNKVQFILYSYC